MNIKNKRYLIIMLLINLTNIALDSKEKLVKISERGGGFFGEFLGVLNFLEYCKKTKKIPTIYWGQDFAYYSPDGYSGSKNGWEYYFEPVSNNVYHEDDNTTHEYSFHDKFSTIWWYAQYIDNKHLLSQEEQKSFIAISNHEKEYRSEKFNYQKIHAHPIPDDHLYSVKFRKKVKRELLDAYIRIKPQITKKIEDFYNKYMLNKKNIGIHLRGNFRFNEVIPVDINHIFQEANKYSNDDYQFFVTTDQYPLIEEAKKHLKGAVIYYDCQRFEATTSPTKGEKLSPKLGEDVLIETILLSRCDHLIHTLSNVSTVALYFNSELSHTVLY